MSSYSAYPPEQLGAHVQQRGTFVDPDRQGTVWQQALVGVVGIVLAIALVVGQVSVATSRGIQRNLHGNIKHLKDGNKTMMEVIAKAEPSVQMAQVVGEQQKLLEHTRITMGLLNGEMGRMGETTDQLASTVNGMHQTSSKLAVGVEGMNRDTAQIVQLLEKLPAATERTHSKLSRISSDSAAINGELNQISGKMQRYGLPHAKHVRGGGR